MDVEKFLSKAEAALRKRAAPQAIALYRQVLVASPGHGGARAGLLAAFRRKAELKGGPGMLDKAAAKSLRAAAAGLRGAALIKTCETGLERDPGDGFLAGRLAGALVELDRPEEALAVWEHRLALDGDDLVALREAGRLHYGLRQIEPAMACLQRAHEIDPHDPDTEKLRKNLAAEGTLAATGFDKASSSRELIKDKDALIRAEREARLHRTAAELSDDIDALAARVVDDPDDVDARRTLVRARLKGHDFEGAETAAREATERFPDDAAWRDLVGDVRLARAKAAVEAAASDAGAAKAARDELARVEVEELGRRVQLDPTDVPRRVRLARACYRAGETDQAIEHFQAVVQDPRVEVEARQGLGACFFRKGLLPLARRQFEQGLAAAGGVGGDRGKEICYHLGLVCERLDDVQGALARYMEIYEVDIHFKDVAAKIESLQA